MPRDAGGVYSLYTPGNPVVPETIISSDWANPTLEDVAASMTDSLSRSGKGGMTAPLRGPDGSEGVPTFSFTSELDSGRWRQGPGQVVESIQGQKVVRFRAAGMDQWNQALNGGLGDWEPLTPRDAAGTPYNPSFSALTSDNVQDAIDEVVGLTGGVTTADEVTYDDQRIPVYFPAATVQIAIDRLGVDLSSVANDVATLFGDITIIEGDLALLESQVLTNSTDILTNANNITINNDNFVGFYNTEFLPLRTRVDNVEFDNITQDGEITDLTNEQNSQGTRITNNSSAISSLQTRMTNTEGATGTNTTKININTGDISDNADDISSNLGKINTNTSSINSLGGRVTDNETDIGELQGAYSNGVLRVSYGGTGTTTSTGGGNNVLHSGATLFAPDLQGGATAVTTSTGEDSTRIATTAWVKNQGYPSDIDVVSGSNGNGYYAAARQSGGRWQVWQWGRRVFGSGTRQDYPAGTYSGDSTQVTMTVKAAGTGGSPSGPNITAISSTSFNASTEYSYECTWMVMGEASV